MLINSPCEFIVQLPSNEGEYQSPHGHQDRQRDQHGPNVNPEVIRNEMCGLERFDSVVDLVVLNSRIDKNAGIVEYEADDLNSVFLL